MTDRSERTLWHGRFEGGPADELLAFTVSLDYDRRLAADDLTGSRAHVRGPGAGRASSPTTRPSVVLAALDRVEDELRVGRRSRSQPTDEDIHTAIERRVTDLAGPAGAKLHTGRSRNDQVATDLRLWTKRELADVARRVLALQRVLLERAADAGRAYLPGYTHLQRAQPVLLAHHLLAHGWALARDVDRLLDCRRRLDVSPLGAGALAGSSLPLDPDGTADDLGLRRPLREQPRRGERPRLRGRGAVRPHACSAIHLSPMGEEVVLWSTDEFGFVRLDDAYATGLVDAAAEEEPRHRRAGPGQGRPGASATSPACWPRSRACRSATTATCRRTRSRCSTPSTRCRSPWRAMTGPVRARSCSRPTGCRQAADSPVRGGHRPGRAAGRAGHAVPRGPRARRRRSCATASSATCRWPSWSRPTPTSGPRGRRCSSRASPVGRRTHRRAAPGPTRWPRSSSALRRRLDADAGERRRPVDTTA